MRKLVSKNYYMALKDEYVDHLRNLNKNSPELYNKYSLCDQFDGFSDELRKHVYPYDEDTVVINGEFYEKLTKFTTEMRNNASHDETLLEYDTLISLNAFTITAKLLRNQTPTREELKDFNFNAVWKQYSRFLPAIVAGDPIVLKVDSPKDSVIIEKILENYTDLTGGRKLAIEIESAEKLEPTQVEKPKEAPATSIWNSLSSFFYGSSNGNKNVLNNSENHNLKS